jgi:Xaa-Pro dipeptidase
VFTAGERLERSELTTRHARCRALLRALLPEAGGLLVTGHPAIYYFTGTLADGVLWLPLEGEPVLAVRKGIERAGLESPLEAVAAYRGFQELPSVLAGAGSALPGTVAVDKAGLTWQQAELLLARLPGYTFLSGDGIVARTRAIKSEEELRKLREAGRRHHQALRFLLPRRIRPGQSELAIGHALWDIFFSLEHCGPLPTGLPGSGLFLGNICAGENGNYPTAYNGPLGIKGTHPAAPAMGHARAVWQKGDILTIDVGFNFEGYLTDKTEVYFAGRAEDIPAPVRKAQAAAEAIETAAAAMLRPGMRPAAIYAEGLRMARDLGFADGFMGLGGNKVPFLGHGIGLTVSDWPIIAQGFGEPLEPGMVVALEPKIGLPGYGMAGTENTYEITPSGARCLTGNERGIIRVAAEPAPPPQNGAGEAAPAAR